MRALLLALAAPSALGASCTFSRKPNSCPSLGQPCTSEVLCQASTCSTSYASGSSGATVQKCASLKSLSDTYLTPCNLNDPYACQFSDPLAANPYQRSQMQCVPSATVSGMGQCALGPQKASDGCNVGSECASGTCQKRGSASCTGIEEGEPCRPPSGGDPDPCEGPLWCAPTGVGGRGTCQKVVSANRPCNALGACEQGTICASSGAAGAESRCIPYLSLGTGVNTTVGPYLCASGTVLQVSESPRVFQCTLPNITMAVVGRECTPGVGIPPGFECTCAADGKTRFTTVGGYGIGSRTTAYQDLYKCLKSAKTPQNTPCLYDYTDFERMRYGSCVFYACYPAYIALMNSTGGRFYAPPLLQFSTAAACEAPTIKSFYESLYSTPCITIPNLDSWKCALLNPGSLSVAATQAVVTLIILGWFGGYLYHMRAFGGEGALANWLQAPLKDDPGSAARLE